MTLDVKTRVAAGVAFLDGFDPSWRVSVDASELNLNNTLCCVLAQVTGMDFWAAVALVCPVRGDGEQIAWTKECGFDGPDIDELQSAWLDVLCGVTA